MARKKLPEALAQSVLYSSAYSCVICQGQHGLHVHHIDKNNSNNVEDNLVVLCQAHHDEAHTLHELSRNLTPARIKGAKKNWLETVAERRVQIATSTGNQKLSGCDFVSTQWGYINHHRVALTVRNPEDDGENGALFNFCLNAGMVDSRGRVLRPSKLSPARGILDGTIYDWFPHTYDWRLHALYSHYVNAIVKSSDPFHVTDETWKRTLLNDELTSGRAVFLNRGFYFKRVREEIDNAQVHIRTFKNKIEFEFEANTRDMFGTTSITSSFKGHNSVAALVLVKSREHMANKLVFHCTPIAMGVGFLAKSPLVSSRMALQD